MSVPTCSFAVPVALTSFCQKYLEMVVPYHTNKFCRYGIILPTIPPYHCALWGILYVWWHIARFRRMPLVGTGSRKQNSRYGSMVVSAWSFTCHGTVAASWQSLSQQTYYPLVIAHYTHTHKYYKSTIPYQTVRRMLIHYSCMHVNICKHESVVLFCLVFHSSASWLPFIYLFA